MNLTQCSEDVLLAEDSDELNGPLLNRTHNLEAKKAGACSVSWTVKHNGIEMRCECALESNHNYDHDDKKGHMSPRLTR